MGTYKSVYVEKYHKSNPGLYPLFRYHPDPLSTMVFEEAEESVPCCCCGRMTNLFYDGPFHTDDDLDEPRFCPLCISDGCAAEKYDGEFTYGSDSKSVDDPAKTDELIHRTPDYITPSYSEWRVHCNDYCAYLGSVNYSDIVDMGLVDELMEDTYWQEYAESPIDLLKSLERYGPPQGNLFQCLSCGKHLLFVDLEYCFE